MKPTLLILFSIYTLSAFGQYNPTPNHIDSLTRILAQSTVDTARFHLLFQLGLANQSVNPAKAVYYFNETLNLAKSLNDRQKINSCLVSLSFLYSQIGESPKSIEMLQEVLHYSEKEKDSFYMMALAFIGINYQAQGDFRNALAYARRAYLLFETTLADTTKPVDERGYVTGPLKLGEIFEKLNRLDSALYYAQMSYQRLLEKPQPAFFCDVCNLLGKIHSRLNHNLTAIGFYRRALNKAVAFKFPAYIQTSQLALAHFYAKTSQPDSVIHYATQAYEGARKIKGFEVMKEAAGLLRLEYEKQDLSAKALYYNDLAVAARDSVTGAEKVRAVQLLTFKEESRQQRIQQETEQEKTAYQTKVRIYSLSAVLAGLLLVAIILYRNNRQKQRLNDLLARQKTEIETLNNNLERTVEARTAELQQALNEVQTAFAEGQTTERRRVSADLHDEIGSALSTIAIFSDLTKRKAQKTAPELVDELERIGTKSRDMIQTMRDTIWTLNENNPQSLWERMYQFSNETLTAKGIILDWQVVMNEQPVPVAIKRNVLMAYKEALHNIVKHAGATAVRVSCSRVNNEVELTVSDNGKGFNVAGVQGQGNGLQNFTARMNEIGGKATITSSVGKGTTLTFRWCEHPYN